MNLLLLGNGYDLSMNLPTAYIDFLDTVNYIREHRMNHYGTIADLWSSGTLRARNKHIEQAYCKYEKVYRKTILPDGFTREVGMLAEESIWFCYLLESFNKDVGWIDFEQEIQAVIQSFHTVLDASNGSYIENAYGGFHKELYIVLSFNFFTTGEKNEKHSVLKGEHPVRPEYLIEYPLGSGNLILNKDKIIEHLYDKLSDLANLLQKYLEVFIDNPFETIVKEKMGVDQKTFVYTDKAITLNYTHSFEKLYPTISVLHLHGEVGKKIVLGINSDDSDDGTLTKTDYIAFKKYFQRLVYGTDKSYISFIEHVRKNGKVIGQISLSVMGHSLDISDRDVIVDLFSVSSSITVLYHNQAALENYVKNIVRIFGKSGLDELRAKKDLKFQPLSDEKEYIEEQGFNTFEEAFR